MRFLWLLDKSSNNEDCCQRQLLDGDRVLASARRWQGTETLTIPICHEQRSFINEDTPHIFLCPFSIVCNVSIYKMFKRVMWFWVNVKYWYNWEHSIPLASSDQNEDSPAQCHHRGPLQCLGPAWRGWRNCWCGHVTGRSAGPRETREPVTLWHSAAAAALGSGGGRLTCSLL